MVLRKALRYLKQDDVLYLGCRGSTKKENGSGYVYIGYVRNAPVDTFGEREVVDKYERYTDIPGTAIIISGTERGKYWFWNECDPNVPIRKAAMTGNYEKYEELLIGIVKQAVTDYKASIHKKTNDIQPEDEMEFEEVISRARHDSAEALEFANSSEIGKYIVNAVEDEARILFKHPEIKNMKYDDRYEILAKKRKEMLAERVRKAAAGKYATIKGKSVNHEIKENT